MRPKPPRDRCAGSSSLGGGAATGFSSGRDFERGHILARLGGLAAARTAIVIPLCVHAPNLTPKSGGVSVPASSKESQDVRIGA